MTKKVTFEESIKELEKIVDDLESGELDLDQSIFKFEKGIKLTKQCSSILDDAERKISLLIEKDGEYRQVPFNDMEE